MSHKKRTRPNRMHVIMPITLRNWLSEQATQRCSTVSQVLRDLVLAAMQEKEKGGGK